MSEPEDFGWGQDGHVYFGGGPRPGPVWTTHSSGSGWNVRAQVMVHADGSITAVPKPVPPPPPRFCVDCKHIGRAHQCLRLINSGPSLVDGKDRIFASNRDCETERNEHGLHESSPGFGPFCGPEARFFEPKL